MRLCGVNTHACTVLLQSQLSTLICSDIHCYYIVHNHPYIAVKIVLTSASTATSYVGMIVNNVAKLCNVAANSLFCVLCQTVIFVCGLCQLMHPYTFL